MRTLETSEAGLIALAGGDPRWIWAFTCPTPGCDCRTAVVLSTDGAREVLVARGAPVRDAWLRSEGHAKAAAALEGVTAFAIDIDEGEVFPAYGEDPFNAFDFAAHPEARDVVDRIDGETLEELGRLWYLGKGWPDPEAKSFESSQIKVENRPAWRARSRCGSRGQARGSHRRAGAREASRAPRAALGSVPEETPALSRAIRAPLDRHAGARGANRRRAARGDRAANGEGRPQRSLSVRVGKEIQEVLRSRVMVSR